jgi:hypothetical protein
MLDNINPKLWGKYFWKMLHYVTFAYPSNPTSEDKKNMMSFFVTFKEIIPCEKCRYNFKQHLVNNPLNDDALANKQNLILWLLKLHNDANKSLGKPEVTLNQLSQMYFDEEHSNINNTTDTITNLKSIKQNNKIVTMLLTVVIICVLIYYVKNK